MQAHHSLTPVDRRKQEREQRATDSFVNSSQASQSVMPGQVKLCQVVNTNREAQGWRQGPAVSKVSR